MHVIEVDDVWKQFRIPHERREHILNQVAGVFSVLGKKRYDYEEFWALRQVDLRLNHGESVGIIGPNGSGKSTLLKIIARVMKPDRGAVMTHGSIAPVLELGIGFHGELTVSENAIVYGVIMGLQRSEMKKCTHSILDFAGLARFRDAPLKNLSSGMRVRLAFSIAIQTRAEIFLIDEALAVGDIAFRRRCMDKFREFKKEGRSIVLVSHNVELVRGFCEKTLYLLRGGARFFGSTEEAINQYVQEAQTSVPSK